MSESGESQDRHDYPWLQSEIQELEQELELELDSEHERELEDALDQEWEWEKNGGGEHLNQHDHDHDHAQQEQQQQRHTLHFQQEEQVNPRKVFNARPPAMEREEMKSQRQLAMEALFSRETSEAQWEVANFLSIRELESAMSTIFRTRSTPGKILEAKSKALLTPLSPLKYSPPPPPPSRLLRVSFGQPSELRVGNENEQKDLAVSVAVYDGQEESTQMTVLTEGCEETLSLNFDRVLTFPVRLRQDHLRIRFSLWDHGKSLLLGGSELLFPRGLPPHAREERLELRKVGEASPQAVGWVTLTLELLQDGQVEQTIFGACCDMLAKHSYEEKFARDLAATVGLSHDQLEMVGAEGWRRETQRTGSIFHLNVQQLPAGHAGLSVQVCETCSLCFSSRWSGGACHGCGHVTRVSTSWGGW
ncbi:hypothetical protein GUITHDRAFT_143188 [Guillardia theta CCMP2712]|uniref:C2 domain-containing protein n=1 Tax=Guillardia theta (strain CCMP2712) TaxID=905079 RepID=L1IVA7_GUITC|nr:hypothetical protein GUITHDRAFT_143188 [Guillardia theta CCMP2712]EKX39794.1 hypothetical protein GUITHDRAFT_143188 [Guillardia theta CCMP2712]|eukprot:XP_005826774.1 hypothetical protein GUITHDRAFT_143188 [Guillardia theta CCMP2712]